MKFACTYELYLFRLDVAKDVVAEFPRAAEELGFIGRESCAAVDLCLKQTKRTYEVRNLEEPVLAGFHGLRKFNGTWQRRGGDTPKKVGDGLLATVVIDLDVPACDEPFPISNGKVGELAFKRGCHLMASAGIALVDGEAVVREVDLAGKCHHAMEYPAAEATGHEPETVVAAKNWPGMEAQVFDADFLKPSRKLGGCRLYRNPLVVQDKSKYVKARCRGWFAKDSRFVHKKTQCVVLSHRPINKSDGNRSSSLKAEDFPRITTTPILRSTSLNIVANHCVQRKGEFERQ